MEFDDLKFRIYQLKKAIKSDSIVLFSDGSKNNPDEWSWVNKKLVHLRFKVFKVSNYASKKAVLESVIEKSLRPIFSGGVSFVVYPDQRLITTQQTTLLQEASIVFFTILSVKINLFLYDVSIFENCLLFEYKSTSIAETFAGIF